MKTVPRHRATPPQCLRNLMLTIPLLILTACGGGGGDSSAPSTPANLVATAVLSTAPVENCPNGGITVEGGIDSNSNKILDPSEVTSTQYVCNGAAGTNGSNGATGANGLTTLVLVTNEAAGANCATGGKKITAGKDANNNATLDASEMASTAYVCNGANGSNGSNGTNGTNGSNGTTGSNGLNSLVSIVPEPKGAMCAYGGSKVSSGMDSNANNVLDEKEVTASHYACNGAPGVQGPAGSGITWVNVTGTTVQAAANTGYLANNDVSQVTLTLPAAPVLGDIVQVSGIGAGGWKIAQNAGQSILTKNIIGSIGAVWGAVWTARETVRNWQSVASSADGSKLVAGVFGGQLYTSTDSGMTWTARDAVRNWYSVASSADGSKLVAADNGGLLYTSTDSGVTWTARDAVRFWYSVASSADGSKLVAAAYGGLLYTSTDSGVTWTARDALRNWVSVASSADGSKLVAADNGGRLYTSTDSGMTWTARDAVKNWVSVTSSANGSKLVAAFADSGKLVIGQLYTSNDSGMTWTARGADRRWSSVASSADGSKLVAAAYLGELYTSDSNTTIGTAGSLSGGQYDAVDLQCVGNNTFMVRGYAGSLFVQ